MKNKVYTTPQFDHKFKRYRKKYLSLDKEMEELVNDLETNAKTGINLGGNIYKIRLASKSKGKGKSGGFRIITYYIEQKVKESEVYLITIYDKAEEANIPKDVLIKLIHRIFN